MSNKTCCICYNKHTNDNLKCKTCKNEVCDECYSNIIFNNQIFMPNFIIDKQLYHCPFCNFENNSSTNINNFNVNNKLIKLLIFKLNKNNSTYNELLIKIIDLQNYNKEILNDNKDLENQIQNLRNFNFEILKKNKELKNQINNIEIQNINTEINAEILNENIELKQQQHNKKLQLEYKPVNDKLEKIENVIKKTNKKTILFNQIIQILNE